MNIFTFSLFSICIFVLCVGNPLGPYKISDVTVSGLSSGGFMAVQMHVSFSSIVNGAAVFAGGPFYCAQGNVMNAQYQCMQTYQGPPDPNKLYQLTIGFESSAMIDQTSNLRDDNIFIFSGADDSVVDPKVVKALQSYYQYFVDASRIQTQFSVKAEHCWPTPSYGEACTTLSSPYIGKCAFDGAGAAVAALFGSNVSQAVSSVSANLMSFDQTPFWPDSQSSLASTGYIYVPTSCSSGGTCHLHVSFHGCDQTQDTIGNQYAAHIGLNEWAEANKIVVLYPYVKKSSSSPSNPNGCWDWWGYTNKNYAVQIGKQMQFARNLIKSVAGI